MDSDGTFSRSSLHNLLRPPLVCNTWHVRLFNTAALSYPYKHCTRQKFYMLTLALQCSAASTYSKDEDVVFLMLRTVYDLTAPETGVQTTGEWRRRRKLSMTLSRVAIFIEKTSHQALLGAHKRAEISPSLTGLRAHAHSSWLDEKNSTQDKEEQKQSCSFHTHLFLVL